VSSMDSIFHFCASLCQVFAVLRFAREKPELLKNTASITRPVDRSPIYIFYAHIPGALDKLDIALL